jgi:hypothetical protein
MKESRRSIKTTFWTDPENESLGMFPKLLLNSMHSFPENNLAGVMKISTKRMHQHTEIPIDEMEKALQILEENDRIYRVNNWIAIRNHIDDQDLNHTMACSTMGSLLKAPKELIQKLVYEPGTKSPELWVQKLTFHFNKYIESQRGQQKKIFLKYHKEASTEEVEQKFPKIDLTVSNLIHILVNPLPFPPEEISNFSNITTVVEPLSYGSRTVPVPLSTMEKESEREMEREREKEIKTRETTSASQGEAEADPFSDFLEPESEPVQTEPTEQEPEDIPERMLTINDTMISTYGKPLRNGQLSQLDKLLAKHYADKICKELRKAKARAPTDPIAYLASYMLKHSTKKKPAQPITEFDEEVEF